MDKFFDRLGDLLRFTLNSGSNKIDKDSDYHEAWAELDAFLRDDQPAKKPRTRGYRTPSGYDDPLKTDYANLEVPYGADFEEIKRSHKRLLRKYHPDPFARDPDKQRVATQISQKINESFQRLTKMQNR